VADDNIIVINQPGGGLERRIRNGKVRYSIGVQAEPIIHNLDPSLLGRGPAEAIADVLRQKVRNIGAIASVATRAYRARAQKAFNTGASWATRRYAGGRIGAMAPNQTPRAFNDSGRFASSLFATPNKTESTWTINVAANRLNEASGAVVTIWNRLVQLVPEFGSPEKLLGTKEVTTAVRTSLRDLIAKAEMRRDDLTAARARAILGVVSAAARALVSL
jgi:hypothetical protein